MHLGQLLGFIRGLGNRHGAALTKTLVFRPIESLLGRKTLRRGSSESEKLSNFLQKNCSFHAFLSVFRIYLWIRH